MKLKKEEELANKRIN
jgi:hypothetical protein